MKASYSALLIVKYGLKGLKAFSSIAQAVGC